MNQMRLIVAAIVALAWPAVLAAQPLSASEARQLEMLSQPESWFLEQLGGKRTVVDGQTLDPKLQFVLAKEQGAPRPPGAKPPPDPGATPEGRRAMRAGSDRAWTIRSKVTAEMASVRDEVVKGRGGDIAVRVYRPKVEGPLPVLVYFHGGGWLFGSLDGSDRATRLMANEARVVVISVAYRLAPESPYPAAWDDAEDAWTWARANAARLGGDPAQMGVGGDSAGGNLAVNVSARALKAGKPAPLYQLLYYPALDMGRDYKSWTLFSEGYGLDREFADYAVARVFPNMDLANPEISPIRAKSLKGMPATILATAGFDILRDSGRAYAGRLERDGVSVIYLNYSTLNHSFLQATGVVADADRAATQTAQIFGQAIRSRTPH
jgi:acetyl esterase/lipase